jgi:hypothetical protein
MSAEHHHGGETPLGLFLSFLFCGGWDFVDSLGKILGFSEGGHH